MDNIKVGDYVIVNDIEDSVYESKGLLVKGDRLKVLGINKPRLSNNNQLISVKLRDGNIDQLFTFRFIKCPTVDKFDNKLKDILK